MRYTACSAHEAALPVPPDGMLLTQMPSRVACVASTQQGKQCGLYRQTNCGEFYTGVALQAALCSDSAVAVGQQALQAFWLVAASCEKDRR